MIFIRVPAGLLDQAGILWAVFGCMVGACTLLQVATIFWMVSITSQRGHVFRLVYIFYWLPRRSQGLAGSRQHQ
ncbi:hypothetical protein DSUL_60217 [Desulfovibrionales bacterium]